MNGFRLVIGLTGGIGSGKSTVADLFAAHGVPIVDTDAIAHALTGAGGAAMPELRRTFGDWVATADGALDRGAMREAAFKDPQQRRKLEAILHPMIRECSGRMLQESVGPYSMLVVPLMIESGNWRTRAHRLLVVDCPDELRIERVMRRSRLAREQVEAIMASQATREQRLAAADDIVDNSGEPATLGPQVDALHARYLELARQGHA